MDLQEEMQSIGAQTVIAETSDELSDALAQHRFDWALLDFNLGNTSTLTAAEQLNAAGTKVCFVSGSDIPAEVLQRLDARLFAKPVHLASLRAHILPEQIQT